MDLTDEDVEEFRSLWKKEFGKDLAPEEARFEANRLLSLYALLARPLAKRTETEGLVSPMTLK